MSNSAMIPNYRKFIVVIAFILLSMMSLSSKEIFFEKWHLDKDIKVLMSIESGILKIEISNKGSKPRKILSSIFDVNYILSNNLTVGIDNFSSPRLLRENFRFAADGIIGVNSEIFKVNTVDFLPDETKTLNIDIIECLKKVDNKKLQKYLFSDGTHIHLHFKIPFRDIGLDTDASIRYEFPTMLIKQKEGSPILLTSIN